MSDSRGMTEAEWIQAIAISKKKGMVDTCQGGNGSLDFQTREVMPFTGDVSQKGSKGIQCLSFKSGNVLPKSTKALTALKSVDVQELGSSRPLIVKGSK